MRLWPVLARDAQRLADAQRRPPGGGASRVAVLRAVTAGALDRATDVAATLRCAASAAGGRRGCRARGRATTSRSRRRRWRWRRSRSALPRRVGDVRAVPAPEMSIDGPTLVAIAAFVACALLPFADRRGIGR
jgi:energy-coupling factor transport system permease protein